MLDGVKTSKTLKLFIFTRVLLIFLATIFYGFIHPYPRWAFVTLGTALGTLSFMSLMTVVYLLMKRKKAFFAMKYGTLFLLVPLCFASYIRATSVPAAYTVLIVYLIVSEILWTFYARKSKSVELKLCSEATE